MTLDPPQDAPGNPADHGKIVLASVGVDTCEVQPSSDGANGFGTLRTLKTNFANLTAELTIVYDGDADPTRTLRSPANLDLSALFDEPAGTPLLFDVQAHGIEDRDAIAGNADSRILLDDNLVEDGQLGFLLRD